MTYDEIRKMPTTVTREQMQGFIAERCSGVHESTLRSYQILQKVKFLLEQGTLNWVISELIQMMESELP